MLAEMTTQTAKTAARRSTAAIGITADTVSTVGFKQRQTQAERTKFCDVMSGHEEACGSLSRCRRHRMWRPRPLLQSPCPARGGRPRESASLRRHRRFRAIGGTRHASRPRCCPRSLRKAWAGRLPLDTAVLAASPARSRASRIAASLTESATLSSVAIFSSSHAIRSAASSMRCRALRFTCGALAP